jgi:hypothetical protein
VTRDVSGQALLGSKLNVQKVATKKNIAWTQYDPAAKNCDQNARAGGPPVRTLKTMALRPAALIRDPGGTASEIIEAREDWWNVWTLARAIEVT